MIDLHCHILPGADDGAQSLDDALDMARTAVADGITTMVAAVHTADPRGVRNAPEEVRAAAEALDLALRRDGIPLSLFCAHEVMITEQLSRQLRAGELVTVADRRGHLLVELPALMVPLCAEQVLFEAMAQGVTPVLVHPEKNLEVQRDLSIAQRMVDRGCLIQIDADSIDGRVPREVERTAVSLLRQGLAHIVATDGHWPTERPPVLSAAREHVRKLLGDRAARRMTEDLPRTILGLPYPPACR
jgi:protein-tyrosine phosphatase